MNSVKITDKVNDVLNDYICRSSHSKIAVLVDENTKHHCYPLVNFPEHVIIEITSGEINKNLSTCTEIWKTLTDHQFDRSSLLINLGGGVIGDMGGFCARTYKRGITFINIPTTLLAQVDASVGGKLGIDFNEFKNHIGLFSEPDLVIIDSTFLQSLPNNQLLSGFAEVIKHHLIADKEGWEKLKKYDFEQINWEKVISHSVDIKTNITTNDFKESGLRKSLNFGHTIGHAFESYFLESDQKLLHGEAVALGMICEAHISYQKDRLSKGELSEITEVIRKYFPLTFISDTLHSKVFELMGQDKKNNEGEILAVLLNKIGEALWDQKISKEEVLRSFEYNNQT